MIEKGEKNGLWIFVGKIEVINSNGNQAIINSEGKNFAYF